MLIVETDKKFEDYIRSLSKKGKQNFAYTMSHNEDLVYRHVPFEKETVHQFMQLWERQLVRGKNIQWAFPVEHVERIALEGRLYLFAAYKGEAIVALHFVESHGNYIEAHPPMYEKSAENKNRYLAKWMWFNLIKFAMDNGLPRLNLGGGIDTSWREMIKRREEFQNPKYKWLYVPSDVKNNPDAQPDYALIDKTLII